MGDSSQKDIKGLSNDILTPDLARQNGEMFTQNLVLRAKQNPRMGPIIHGLESIGKFSQSAVVLRDSWTSETTGDSPRIVFGFQEIPKTIQDQVFYTGTSAFPKGYEQQLVYRFNHEVTHKYVDFMVFDAQQPQMMELFELASEARVEGDVGFTAFGHIDNQGRQVKQANEDVTELLNMYIWDPQYLREYLSFLANPHTAELRDQYKLVGLTPESRDHVFQLIETIVTSPGNS